MSVLKKFLTVVLVIFICIGFVYSPSAFAKKKYTIKIATLAPKSVGWAKNIRAIMHPAIKRATDGNVKLKWYWGGVLGDDRDYIQKMKIGQIDGAAFSGQGVVLACPPMAILELPFMFENWDEIDFIRDKMLDTFDKMAEENGYKLVMWADQDFDQIYSIKYKMATYDDFKKARVITWYGPLEQKVLETLGSSPVPVGVPEIVSSMRQGIADTCIAPSIAVVGFQMYTIIKYVNPINIRYSPAASLCRLEFWNSMPAEYRKNLDSVRQNELKELIKRCREDSERAYNAMIKYGMQETKMDPAVVADMKAKCKEIWYDMAYKSEAEKGQAGKYYSKKTLDELIHYLEEFRAKKK